ncbi:MAG: hypothetical protein MZV63_10500 [Marinilabiliales bacterium]|nr:hypothetical protein [Marinilabiliales bacterium]
MTCTSAPAEIIAAGLKELGLMKGDTAEAVDRRCTCSLHASRAGSHDGP